MTKTLVVAAVLALLLAPPLAAAVLVASVGATAAVCFPAQPSRHQGGSAAAGTSGLSRTQLKRAAVGVRVGQTMGIGAQGIVVALAAASQESSFRILANDGAGGDLAANQAGIDASLRLPHDGVGSDHGSLGVLQQQWPTWSDSMGELMDPAASYRLFYQALRQVQGWQRLPVTEAAQAVQHSDHPGAYADDEPLARALYAELAGSPAADTYAASTADARCAAQTAAGTASGCPATVAPAEAGLSPDALRVLRCVDARFGAHIYSGVGTRSTNPASDHPDGNAVDIMIQNWQTPAGVAAGDAIADWVRGHARQLGVTYVIWRDRIWNAGEPGWSAYRHPSGQATASTRHLDHLHISVHGNAGTGIGSGVVDGVVYPVPAHLAQANRDNWGAAGGSWSAWHTGTDFSVGCGTPVLAAHAGTVSIDRDTGWAGPYLVKVRTGPRQLATWYAHMRKVLVADGEVVAPGQPLGEVGAEGNSTGCHLHFEVHTRGGGIYGPDNVDPTPWLGEHLAGTAEQPT